MSDLMKIAENFVACLFVFYSKIYI